MNQLKMTRKIKALTRENGVCIWKQITSFQQLHTGMHIVMYTGKELVMRMFGSNVILNFDNFIVLSEPFYDPITQSFGVKLEKDNEINIMYEEDAFRVYNNILDAAYIRMKRNDKR
jgi:hypothetical protein